MHPYLSLSRKFYLYWALWGFPGGSDSKKKSTCIAGRPGFDSWVKKIPWNRKWQPTPVFLPAESCGQRSVAGYSPPGHKELDTTEGRTHIHTLGSLRQIELEEDSI